MKTISGDDSANPSGLYGQQMESGLTIRQEFAARFLVGILSAKQGGSTSTNTAFVELAVKYADLLIDELNKFGEKEK